VTAIAQVEPLTTARSLRGPFDYRVPDELQEGVAIGSMLVVPFGHRDVLGVVVALAEASEVPEEKLLAPRRALELGVPADLVELARWMAHEYCSTFARALALVLPPGVGRGVTARTGLVATLTEQGVRALAGEGRLTTGQRDALEVLRDGPLPAARVGLDHSGLRRLEGRGLVALGREVLDRARPDRAPLGARTAGAPQLTAAQQAALDPIVAAIDALAGERFLLRGVTGSGKTEVYMSAAARALELGRSVIVLVPEIGLTPQTVGRFAQRFGETVAILHSGLGEGERHDEWRRLREGRARVCVGPRSAVFAPLADVGLIVVDEEHDASYKHEGDPRYDARRVAERRAGEANAVLIAGSATPRPESYRALKHIALPERVDGRGLPPVEILDMREAHHALHPRTAQALADVRGSGGKAIVLLNRRGWANFMTCRSCGHAWMCPSCDVTLVLHRTDAHLACHHCGHREAMPSHCDACGSISVARHGAGTERLEHDLAGSVGREGFPLFRLDADSARGSGRAAAVLRAFEAAPAGVLVGTQMVAKGHDFPDVTLGVVVDADATLRFPDFRAEERTFALVAQLAGRAGRGPGGGRVLVQTLAPDAPSIAHAARHDAEGFLEGELERRAELAYPPFSDLIRIVCASEAVGAAHAAALVIRERLDPPAATVLGPAPLFRLRGRERSQVVVKARERAAAIDAVGVSVATTAAERGHRGVSFSVDVDPQ
jgi:primosomal protein N' (replication factor Y) (superfamily II helicase)